MASDPSNLNAAERAKREADKQKRRAQRIALMQTGMQDLEAWLSDVIREGTATTEGQPYAFWQDISSRMVDTQLSALGPRIRALQLLHHAHSDWPDQLLQELAELYLLARGFHRLSLLPSPLQDQVLRLAGIRDNKKELLQQPGWFDHWGVLGQFEGINIDNGHFRRTWLRGAKSRKIGLLLDYDYQNRGYDTTWEVGRIYSGELVYYPSAYPQRALLKTNEVEPPLIRQMKGYPNATAFREDYTAALAANPWLAEFPCCLEKVRPVLQETDLWLIDEQDNQVPTHAKEQVVWQLIALSGGHPITVFGEWTGAVFLPLSALVNQRLIGF
ncbi:MAG: hypothetical protein AAGD05_11715 [Bacteroidota bacterium]